MSSEMSVVEPVNESSSAPATPGLWANSSFKWFFAGSTLTFLGNQFSLVAIPWLALKLTNSPAMLASSLSLMAIPRVVLMLAGGAVADRHSPRTIITLTNLASTVLLLILAGTLVSGGLTVAGLLSVALLLGTVSAFSVPTAASFLPRVVPRNQLGAANAAAMMARQLTMLLGPVLAGGLIAWMSSADLPIENRSFDDALGIASALAIDAVAFAISALIIRFVTFASTSPPTSIGMFKSIAEAVQSLRKDRPLCVLIFYYSAMLLLLAGPAQVGVPAIVDAQLGMGAAGLGLLMTAMSLGTVAGMAVAGMARWRIARLGIAILTADAIGGLCLVAFAHAHSIVVAALLCFVVGMGGGYTQIGIVTWVQRRVPLQMLGRAMSVLMIGMTGAVPLSAAFTAVLLTHFSIVILLTVSGATLTIIALACLSNSTIRAIEESRASGESTV